jgi:hypothetical protein
MDNKKRQRPVTSCLPCRKRRLKCDRVTTSVPQCWCVSDGEALTLPLQVHPMCGRCRAGGTECVYDESALGRSSTWQSTSTSQQPSSVSTSYGRFEEARAGGPQVDSRYRLCVHTTISQINDPVPATETAIRQSNHERGHISVYDGGRSAYVGSTYWANAIPSEVSLS